MSVVYEWVSNVTTKFMDVPFCSDQDIVSEVPIFTKETPFDDELSEIPSLKKSMANCRKKRSAAKAKLFTDWRESGDRDLRENSFMTTWYHLHGTAKRLCQGDTTIRASELSIHH